MSDELFGVGTLGNIDLIIGLFMMPSGRRKYGISILVLFVCL